MSTLDLILLVPLLYGAWRGYQKGMLLEVVSFIALFAGVLGALKLHAWGMEVMLPHLHIGLQGVAPYVVFLLLFVGLVMGIHVLGKALKTVLSYTLLGSFDSLGGALMGGLKWLLGLSLFVWAADAAGVSLNAASATDCTVYPLLLKIGPKALTGFDFVLPFGKELLAQVKGTLQG